MIPEIDPVTGNLPPGIHNATWDEIVARYNQTARRRELLEGMKKALDALQAAGCRRAYINGSFVGSKRNPDDYDACWEASGIDSNALDPVFFKFDDARLSQKRRYSGEWFIAGTQATRSGRRYPDFFQRDKHTGAEKGIIAIDPGVFS